MIPTNILIIQYLLKKRTGVTGNIASQKPLNKTKTYKGGFVPLSQMSKNDSRRIEFIDFINNEIIGDKNE